MTVQVLRSIAELDDVAAPWAVLADAAGARHNMQPFWCLPWWSHLGQGELFVAVIRSGDDLAALAPLYRRRSFGVDTLMFLASDILGVSEVLIAPGQDAAGDELWAFLLDRPRCVLDLRQHRLAGASVEAIRRTENRVLRAQLGPASPFVSLAGSWDDYWGGRRTKFRRELERMERVAEREGLPVRVEIAFDPGEVDKRIPDITEIFDAAVRTRQSLHFLSGAFRPFTIDFLQRAAEQSRLAVFVLYLGDRPVANCFTLRSGTTIGGSALRFDPAFGRFSPGQLLFRRILEHAFASDCTEFDFGPRDVPYKRQWSTGIYDTLEVSAFSSGVVHAFHIAKSTAEARLRKKS